MLRKRRTLKRLLNAILASAFALSYLIYLVLRVMSDQLLDDDFYTQALEENRIYDRIYSDLLADPQFRALNFQLLGNLRIQNQYSQEMYSQTVSTLRLVLPPDALRAALERIIRELIAYLTGNRERLGANFRLSSFVNDPDLIGTIIAGVQAIQTELFAQTIAQGLGSEEEISALTPQTIAEYLESYMEKLAAGNIEALPIDLATVPIGQLSIVQKQRLADIMLAPVGDDVTDAKRLQIEAALANDDLPGAVVLASGELIQLRVEDAVFNMRSELNSGTFSGVQEFANMVDETSNDVVRDLNQTRDLVLFFQRDFMLPVLLIMGLSLAGLVALNRGSVRTITGLLGAMLVMVSVLALVGWAIFESRVSLPLEAFVMRRTVPDSLQRMLSDILESLLDEMRVAVWWRALPTLACGAVLLLVWAAPRFPSAARIPLLRPRYNRIVVAVVGLLVGGLLLADALLNPPRISDPEMRCNGRVELCDRPFNEVVFPATHNAMSAANLGWIWPHQDGDLKMQLEAGVRAFLIDIHHADTPEEIEQYFASFPLSTRALMQRVVTTATPIPTSDEPLLCHNLCSLGATPLSETLGQFAQFIERHPQDIIVLLMQDEVSPAEIRRAFEESELLRYVYVHEAETPWPTLEEMILNNERVVVFAEQGGPPPAWYHHLWDYAEETPYSFPSPDFFDCVPNRGGTEKPLFLMNHWVARRAPDRVDAAYVNDYEFMLARARACEEQRGQLPNFIAVDFYSIGDLFKVVDTLNGVTG